MKEGATPRLKSEYRARLSRPGRYTCMSSMSMRSPSSMARRHDGFGLLLELRWRVHELSI